MDTLPERINVMKVVTYTVGDIVSQIMTDREANVWVNSRGESGGYSSRATDDVTLDDVMSVIEDWVKDDFGCGWGHDAGLGDLIFQDENGNEL